MKFCFTLFLVLSVLISYSQDPNSLKQEGDTLETIVSDDSVVYVIQAEPVTIVEQVEVVKPKANYYLTLQSSILAFHEYRKSSPGFETYLAKIEEATRSMMSYSIGVSLWKCPKKLCLGYDAAFLRLSQQFDYTSTIGVDYTSYNHFNYVTLGMMMGHWINKGQRMSCILTAKSHIANLMSYSSHTLSKLDYTTAVSMRDEIVYREYTFNIFVSPRFLFAIKSDYIELSPFIAAMPFSSTKKNEAYSIKTMLWGVTIGLTNKLF